MGSLAGPVLNSDEAAKYCGLRGGAKSMRNLKYLGTGPKWHHQGRALVFYPAELDAWLAKRLAGRNTESGKESQHER